MAACSNCGATLKCGCQKVKAQDGTDCCKKCVGEYNLTQSTKSGPAAGQAKVIYNGPGKQLNT